MTMTGKQRKTRQLLALGLFSSMCATGSMWAQYGPPPPPPGYAQGPGGWEAPPPEFAAAQQRGYHDGVEGARKDFQNHREPNVNNRDEYRHPNFIARPDRRSYKIGFQRGYQVAVQHMYGGGPYGPR